MSNTTSPSLIDIPTFKAKLAIRSDSRFFELMRSDPKFPKPIRRGTRFTKFVESEAAAYIEGWIAERDQGGAA